MGVLRSLELLLQQAIEGAPGLAGDVEPLDIVRQIERDIERHRKRFVGDETYVPHRLVVHLHAPTAARVEEYEALFNQREFRDHLEGYIRERGYRLLDRLRVVIRCHQEAGARFRRRPCEVEFSWPLAGGEPGDVTVVFDPRDEGRLADARQVAAEVPEAWLDAIEGEAYEPSVRIARRVFNIGRTQNVLHRQTGRVLRVNHLAFRPSADPASINQSVSRQHAQVVYRDVAFAVVDTGSQNGTSVMRGGSTLLVPRMGLARDAVPLEAGDVLALGRARVRFRYEVAGDAAVNR